MSLWWLFLIIPGSLVIGGVVVYIAVMLYIGEGIRRAL